MELTSDSHFYNIPVNTNYSSVHVPTNVWDLSPAVIEAIDWSEALDGIFRQNYKSDPALSWQYFGSMTGMLRQYPAMQWRTDHGADGLPVVDQYDCRTRSWFIEAATCSKDVVILVDTSGSMEGMGKTIGMTIIPLATSGRIGLYSNLLSKYLSTFIEFSNFDFSPKTRCDPISSYSLR